MHTLRKIAMFDALGVVAYSRVHRLKARQDAIAVKDIRNESLAAVNVQKNDHVVQNDEFLRQVPMAAPVALIAPRSVARTAVVSRMPSIRSELVLPSAEIDRFLESRMYRHFCLLLAHGVAIPVVENAVLSDTALHFELPPKAALKLGSMALLRSAWRAKRQAWLAIRVWRKQQRPG